MSETCGIHCLQHINLLILGSTKCCVNLFIKPNLFLTCMLNGKKCYFVKINITYLPIIISPGSKC